MDAYVKNYNLGGVIARSCEIADVKIQGREVKVCQCCEKSEVQTLRTESGVEFKSDAGSLGLCLQHIFKNQPCQATT